MNNTHEEAERILSLVEQLRKNSADEKLQAQIIESALVRERKHVVDQACEIIHTIQVDVEYGLIDPYEAEDAIRERFKA